MTTYFNGSFTERLRVESTEARKCTCLPYPCRTFWDCSTGCAACQANGGPLFSDAETTWEETGAGLPKETAKDLRKLSGSHGSSGLRAKQRTKGAA